MADSRPNVLWLFTDQQRFDTIRALGNPVVKTPNLDRLAASGVAFTDAYTPCPVCVPARGCIKYGQYPWNSGCFENNYPMPEDGRESFMGALTREGYRTHGIGKCHFRPDTFAMRGFETREVQEEGTHADKDDYLTYLHGKGYRYVCEPHGIRGEMYYVPQPSQVPAELHPTQWVGDRSVDFIEAQNDSDRPWMLFSSYIHPHPPFTPPNPWHKLYRAPHMPLPKVPHDVDSLKTWVNRHQNRYKYRDQGIDLNLMRNIKAHYYACISFIDYQVGRILDALERTGQLENTLIVYSSDHGEHLGDYECFGKRSFHDSCTRVPLLVSLPGRFEGGRVCDTPVSTVDIAPTVFSAAGAAFDTHEADGTDLADILSGESDRDAVFMQIQERGLATYMTVTPRWKYAYSAPDDREFLFDRVTDPEETRNMAGAPFRGEIRKELRGRLFEVLRASGRDGGVDGDEWRRYPPTEVPVNPDAGLLIQDPSWPDMSIPGYTDIE